MHEFSLREKRSQEERLAEITESLKWIVDGADSVPVTKEVVSNNFVPLFTENEKYTVGLTYKDSLTADGYLYTVTRSRRPELKVRFPVDRPSFKKSNSTATRALTYTDPEGHFYYVLFVNEMGANSKFPVTIAKIYKSDGLAWSNNYSLPFVPNTLVLKPETSELVVSNDTQQLVIDKNGKLLK